MSRCVCGKYRYWTRKAAKLAIRRIPRRKDETSHLHAYRCDQDIPCWHVGHLPGPIRRGDVARSDWANNRPTPKETNR